MEFHSAFLEAFFKWELIQRYFPAIMKGVGVTIEIAAAVVFTGICAGLALAVIRAFRARSINVVIVLFADAFRALPPLVLVLLVYFGLPNLGINLPSFAVLWIVLSLVLAAFCEDASVPYRPYDTLAAVADTPREHRAGAILGSPDFMRC